MNQSQEQRQLVKNTAKLFGLTFFALTVLLGYIFLVFPVLSPKTAIGFYGTVGLDRAALGTREILYLRTNKVEHLYNLVQASDLVGDHKRTLKYADELLCHPDFEAFAKSMDSYAIEHTKKDQLYAVASLENRLQEMKIRATYASSRNKALSLALGCFDQERIELFYFSEYVNLLLQDKHLTDKQKWENLEALAKTEVHDQQLTEVLSQRYQNFQSQAPEQQDLLFLEQLFQIKRVEIVLLEAIKSPELEQANQELQTLSDAIQHSLHN